MKTQTRTQVQRRKVIDKPRQKTDAGAEQRAAGL